MDAKIIFFILLAAGILLEVAGDIFFKRWALQSKTIILVIGALLYFTGTIFWAFSLKYETLSKAGVIFMLANIILIALAGTMIFKENLSLINKIGIALGIISIILVEL
jgi:multidrug transporter EmrE-like cation transporter